MSKDALERLQKKFPQEVLGTHAQHGDETALVDRKGLLAVCTWLKESPDMDFRMLTDLTVVDYLGMPPAQRVCSPGAGKASNATGGQAPRFEVVYHLLSLSRGWRLRLKVPVDLEDPVVPTVSTLWKSADWMEREGWDLYGIRFEGHPDLRRVLLYEEFVGHPLRKDYPVRQRQPLIPMKNPNA
ncbi:MAG: NADH-quinone oxidoreductase subunit C [Deltaproteobacteria bacterium]|nr:NADH-quinone oxidoreductase subunit C [Deltaproteobacteria bacterium]